MPHIEEELNAIKGDIKRVRYTFTTRTGNAIDISSGVTFTGALYDEEQVLATYSNGSYITTLASSGYLDLLVNCIAEGKWKLKLTSAFALGHTKNHIAYLIIDKEDTPVVTRTLDADLPYMEISATGS